MTNARSTVFKSGMEEGRAQVRISATNWLKERLVDDKVTRPDRGTPEYEYCMELTRELLKHIEGVELK